MTSPRISSWRIEQLSNSADGDTRSLSEALAVAGNEAQSGSYDEPAQFEDTRGPVDPVLGQPWTSMEP